jgi:hypothetical protein
VDIIGKLELDKTALGDASQAVYEKIKQQTPAK